MNNRRKHSRISATINILIKHSSIGEKHIKTKDISDGGLFLLIEPEVMPPIGEVIVGQVIDIPDAPIVDMEIVRVELDGIGLRYLDTKEFT